MDILQAKKLIKDLEKELKVFTEVDEIICDYNNPDEQFVAGQLMQIANKLADAHLQFKYLCKPIRIEGHLTQRSDGRYEIESTDYYFTSGSIIEIWDKDYNRYFLTSIEYKNDDYYATSSPNLTLEGLKVRIR